MSDIGKSLVTELDVIKNRKANPQEDLLGTMLQMKLIQGV